MSERESLKKAQETMRRLQHEVRTPLGQIMGYSELLEEELEDRGQRDLAPDLRKIRDAAQRLLDLVDGKLRTEQPPGAPPLPDGGPTEAAHAEGAEEAAVREGDVGEEGESTRVLVVDDDAYNRDLLARRLRRHGFAVDTARDGIDGLRRIDAEDYDLVLLDVMMPGMNGLEVLERLRRGRSMSELPVILATALAETEDAVEGLERGANDYVTKPFDFPMVIARVRTQLAAHRSARKVAALAHQLEFRNSFIREALGREISAELLIEMAETPESIELGSERRRVTAVVADIKGGRRLDAELSAAQYAAVLRNVLGGLADVVVHYQGTVDTLSGDALLATFGLPEPRADDAVRAAACAVALQLEMDAINEKGRRAKLPEVGIGVGVASGEVVVSGYGAGENMKLKAIGEPLVRAAHIEASGGAGEVWICDATRALLGELSESDHERDVPLPGGDERVHVHRLLGVGGSYLVSLRAIPPLSAG